MRYREYRCAASLSEYISCYWHYEREMGPGDTEEVLPDGFYELILQRRRAYVDGATGVLPGGFVVGLLDDPLVLSARAPIAHWSVRFYSWGLTPFGNVQAIGARRWQDASVVLGPTTSARLAATGRDGVDPDAVCAALDQALLSELLAWTRDDAVLRAAGHLLRERGGSLSVADLAAACHRSRRQLERDFAVGVGRTPRDVAARMRFEYARRLLTCDPDLPLAQVAAEAGYADQSHLARSFGRYARLRPSEFVARIRSTEPLPSTDGAFIQDPSRSPPRR